MYGKKMYHAISVLMPAMIKVSSGRRSPKGCTWYVIMILRRSSSRPFNIFSEEELLEKEPLKELTHLVSPVADIPEEKQFKVGSSRGDTTRSSIL